MTQRRPQLHQLPKMRLRPAYPEDEPIMAAICTRAFFNDDLFGRVIHPFRHTYPDDVQTYWHESLRHCWASPRIRILVAVAESGQGQDLETIIGVAVWERQGHDEGAHKVMKEFSDPGPWPALSPMHNRALDPSRKTILQDAEACSKFYWAGCRATNWYLVLCCVDPKSQQSGCGRLLTSWGVERARKEGVRASVIASDGSTGFYLKCGFDEVVGNASRAGGDANPMKRANVQGGDVLFTRLQGDIESGPP